jgi:CBS domain-containing protein
LQLRNHNSIPTDLDEEENRKKQLVTSLYCHSELSLQSIAQQVGMSLKEVQDITDDLLLSDALQLLVQQSTTSVENIMTRDVISLDISKTAADAAELMSKKRVGSIIVTKNHGRPFGIVTERDLVRRIGKKDIYFRDILLEHFASRPLITSESRATVEEAARTMSKHKIRKLPIVYEGRVVGILTTTDLATFLSPTRRLGLTLSVLQAISRGASSE